MAEQLVYQIFGTADPAHYLHSRYARRAIERFVASPPSDILDAGCGSGDYSFWLADRFPESRIHGVDLNPDLIEKNRATAARLGIQNVHFEVADLAMMTFSECFDLVVSVDVLEHVPEQKQAFANIARALRPGGIFFAHVPTVRDRPVPFSGFLTGFHEWAEREHLAEDHTAAEFIEIVKDSELHVLESIRTFGWWTGEMATSLFALPYRNTPTNRVWQLLLVVPSRILTLLDVLPIPQSRYAVAISSRKT